MPILVKQDCYEESPERSANHANDTTAVEQSRTFGFDKVELRKEGMGQQDSFHQILHAAARA